MSFRRAAGDAIGEPVSPAQPSAFLRSLVTLPDQYAEAVLVAVDDINDETLGD